MIREYRVGDLDRMFQLDEICFEAPFQFDWESMRMFAEAKTAIALVAEDDGGEIAGCLIVHVEGAGGGRRGDVVTLDVAPTCRRAGLAGRMMDKAERQVGLVGGRWMELHVFVENEGAVPNNHLVSNYVGLLVVATLFPQLPGASSWLSTSVAGLREQALNQIHPDGVSFEGSVPYHRLAVELFTLAFVIARQGGIDLGREYEERLHAMFKVAQAYCSERGLAPQLGDNDSGRAFPWRDRPSLDHGYLAPLGAGLFCDPTLKAEGQSAPDELVWLLGERGLRRYERLPAAARPASFRSDASGLHVLRGAEAVVTVSAGPKGQRGVGGHNHCDKLSFELHLKGAAVIVDPGTWTYGRDPQARNAFRSTARHNVVQIDGLEQTPIDVSRLFALPDLSACEVTAFESRAPIDRLTARYHLLPGARGTLVERTFWLDREARALTVSDRLLGEGPRELQSRLHLPDTQLRRRPATPQELAAAASARGVCFALSSEAFELGPTDAPRALLVPSAGAQVRVDATTYSPGYGEQWPALCVVANERRALPANLGFVVLFAEGDSFGKAADGRLPGLTEGLSCE